MFNPTPKLGKLAFGEGFCFVVDDALQDPGALRDFAAGQRARFAQAPFNAYPGIELGLTGAIETALGEFFDGHIRRLLGGRRRVRMAIYELHVRDFSASDDSVPAAHRGKYLAFTDSNSNGMGGKK